MLWGRDDSNIICVEDYFFPFSFLFFRSPHFAFSILSSSSSFFSSPLFHLLSSSSIFAVACIRKLGNNHPAKRFY